MSAELSSYQEWGLFRAGNLAKDARHQATMTGIRLGSLMDQLKFQQDDLAGQERVHEYVQKTALRDAGLDTNLSLDAPDPDDDRNIRPVYLGTREQQLEAQIRMMEEVDARTEESKGFVPGMVGPILGVLAIVIALLNWNKAY